MVNESPTVIFDHRSVEESCLIWLKRLVEFANARKYWSPLFAPAMPAPDKAEPFTTYCPLLPYPVHELGVSAASVLVVTASVSKPVFSKVAAEAGPAMVNAARAASEVVFSFIFGI